MGKTYLTSKVTSNNTVYVKVVNTNSTAQNVQIIMSGATSVSSTGTATVLTSANPTDTNTLSSPTSVVPVTNSLSGLSSSFNYTFAAYSVTVLALVVS